MKKKKSIIIHQTTDTTAVHRSYEMVKYNRKFPNHFIHMSDDITYYYMTVITANLVTELGK